MVRKRGKQDNRTGWILENKRRNKLKQKSFRFTENFGEALNAMDDKRAGQFAKILCAYQFHNKEYTGNDPILKSAFALAKAEMDRSNTNSRNGRLGGLKTAENKRTVVAVQVRSPMQCKTGMELLNKALGGK